MSLYYQNNIFQILRGSKPEMGLGLDREPANNNLLRSQPRLCDFLLNKYVAFLKEYKYIVQIKPKTTIRF